jgi:multiple sugar transport system substrate-binding protein
LGPPCGAYPKCEQLHITPPHTIAELDRDAALLTKEKNGRISLLGFSPNGGISGDDGLQVWAYTFGGNWWNPKTHAVTPTQKGNVAALTWEASYYKKYGTTALSNFNGASYGSGPLGSDPFAFGKVSMELGGEWLHAFLNEYAPRVHFGEVPIPVLHAGDKPVMYPNGDVWIIPSTAPHKAVAWQFLHWLEQPAVFKPICNGMVNLPQFNTLYDHLGWANAALRESVELWKQYRPAPMPQLPNFVKYESLIANAEQQATLGKMSPAAALGQIQAQLGQ